MKHQWLIHEANKWVGVHEAGGDNRGPIVDHFLLSTGGTPGLAWCVAFVRYCTDRVDKDCDLIYAISEEERNHNTLKKTLSVMDLWNSGKEKSLSPIPGWVSCWKHYDSQGRSTGMGHCGVVIKSIDSGRWFSSIEGNTGPEKAGDINRDGDGVFIKTRSIQGSPRFRLLGFLDPWGKS